MAALKQRIRSEIRLRQAELEWQAKTVSHFIISSISHENAKKHQESLFAALDKISLVDPKRAVTDDVQADTSSSKPAFNYADIEERGNYDAALEKNSRRKGGLGGFAGLGVTPS